MTGVLQDLRRGTNVINSRNTLRPVQRETDLVQLAKKARFGLVMPVGESTGMRAQSEFSTSAEPERFK